MTVAAGNGAPLFTSTPPATGTVSQTYRYTPVAVDPDGDPVALLLAHGPGGAAVDAGGQVVWPPAPGHLGATFFTLVAQDGQGGEARQAWAVRVTSAGVPLSPAPVDGDGDGFDTTLDCLDDNGNVNPAQREIPGNGLDDDCNPATPDGLPAQMLHCSLVTLRRSYRSGRQPQVQATVRNVSAATAASPLAVVLRVQEVGGQTIWTTTQEGVSVLPGGFYRTTEAVDVALAQGSYRAALEVRSGDSAFCDATADFGVAALPAAASDVYLPLILH